MEYLLTKMEYFLTNINSNIYNTIMAPKFKCDLCKNSYSSIFSLSNHKRLYHPDNQDTDRGKNFEDDLYHCRYCENKSYLTHRSRWKHEQTCKPTPENKDKIIERIKQENERIKSERIEERDAFKTKIIKLQDKLIKTNRLTDKSFKALNKILMERSYYMNQSQNTNSLNTINSNNTLQICNIGTEDVLHVLTDQQKKQIMSAKFKSLDKLVEITHCGEYNQFKNIIITNLKDDYAYQYDNKKGFFVTVRKHDVITDIIEYRMYNLNEICEEMENGNKIDAKTKIVLQRFIDKCDCEDPFEDEHGIKYPNYKEYRKDCMKILLYNNHERITKDIATLMQDAESEAQGEDNPEEEYLMAIALDSF